MIEKFLERDAPMAQLRNLLTQVADGNGASVIVTGEAGAGKTTFFQVFEADLESNTRIFRGACEDLSIPEPLGPLRELARSAGWDIDFDQLMDGRRLETFAQVLELADDPDQATVLIIEDLHWADEATLDFVRYAARRTDHMRIMLLINSRDVDDAAQQRLRAAFKGVAAENLTRIELKPLSQTAVIKLASHAGVDGAKVFEKSAGNAFYVTELLRNRDHNLPSSVQDAVLTRVDGLSANAQNILNIVSIFPRRAELDFVDALSEDDGFQGIEGCIAEGLLFDTGNFLAFRHEIARLAVEGEISAFKKRALNATLYNLLAKKPATPKARLMHHARAGSLSDAVRELAPEAAQEAEAAGAFRQSAEYYEIALEFRNELPEQEQAELLENAAQVIGSLSEQHKAIDLLNDAFTIRESLEEPLNSVETLRKLVRFHWETGTIQEARDLGDRAIDLAKDSNGIELAWAYAARAQVAMTHYDWELAKELGHKAIDLAERNGFNEVLAHALSTTGMVYWTDPEERGLSMLLRGRALTTENGFLSNASRAFSNVAVYLHEHYRYQEASAAFDAGLKYCRDQEVSSGVELLGAWRLELRERMGQWDEATRVGNEIWANGIQHFSARFYIVLSQARISLRAGLPDAEEKYIQLQELLKFSEDSRHVAHLANLAAERAYLGMGDPDVAFALMTRYRNFQVFPVHEEQFACWEKRLGKKPTIKEEQIFNEPYRRNLAGDWQGEAAAWTDIGSPYHEALALIDGDTAANSRALEILDGLGATVVSEFARKKLQDEGVTIKSRIPRATTKANPAGLTKRQLDVLRLLNDGLSNAEIGEKLFVSPKTVDHHVSAILGKLEVSSRGEAAALAREAGWV